MSKFIHSFVTAVKPNNKFSNKKIESLSFIKRLIKLLNEYNFRKNRRNQNRGYNQLF